MGISYNKKAKNLYPNGFGEEKTNRGFGGLTAHTEDKLSGTHSFFMNSNNYGGTFLGSDFVEVDTSKHYVHAVSMKTVTRNYLNNVGSGHIGFACYDEKKRFIDLRHCGGSGNTFLSRNLSPGDAYIYIQSNSGWETGGTLTGTTIFRHVLFYPATHPEYNQAHRYTRIGLGDFNICYNSLVQMPEGDWRMQLANTSNVTINMPNIGHATPAGTPISRGIAGGSYNYAHGAPNYPEDWTTYITSVFTGENRNSGIPFRFATYYIRFLNLINYNFRTQNAGNSARYLIDNIILVEVDPNNPIPASFYRRSEPW